MNLFLTSIFDQSVCLRLTETLLHFLWEGLLIGMATACVAWLCRNGSARLRYGVHAAGLALMAFSVAVTFLLIDGTTLPALRPVTLAPTIEVANSQTIASQVSIERRDEAGMAFAVAPQVDFGRESAPAVSSVAADSRVEGAERASRAVGEGEIESVSLSAGISSSLESLLLRASPYAVGVYLLGVLVMLGRLGLGLWGVGRLRRSATPLPSGRLADQIREQAARIGLKIVPAVKFCERITIPFVAGVLRPVILLPDWLEAELEPEQLLVIVAHEMAHIRRLDLLVNLLQRLVEATLFFHPAVWYVSRQLSAERENCCDDAVVRAGVEKVNYADILLRVAELCAAPCGANRRMPNASLAISGNQGSQLKRRIVRLLGGEQRVRSRSADSLALVLLVALILGTIAATQSHVVAGAFETLAQTAQDSATVAGQADAVAPPASTAESVARAPQSAEAEITVRGVVLKPDGQPAVGAVVRAAGMADWSSWELAVAKDLVSPLSEAIADSQGMFTIRFPRHPFGDVSVFDEHWRDIYKKTQIGASLSGYGPAWMTYGAIDPSRPLTLRLVEDLPLRGRVIDLEGRPIAGTSVKVSAPRAAKGDDLSEWIAGVKAGEDLRTAQRRIPLSAEPRVIGTPTAVTTDAEGRFEIRGLGRERVVTLTFVGEQIAYREAQAATRDMETLQQNSGFEKQFDGKDSVFGHTFTFNAEPARTVEGIVRDAQTGEVLPGVSVESRMLANYPYGKYGVLKTTTDAQGHFRLIGMPKGTENQLLFAPGEHLPYFQRYVDVPDPDGLGPVTMDVALHPGIWITGKVIDAATGAPVPAVRILYLPFLSNEYAQRTPEFNSSGFVDGNARATRFQSKADGTYRIVGLPGRAIVGAESILKSYRHGVGYLDVSGPKHQEGVWRDRFDTYYNPMKPGPEWPNMMKEIKPPADTGSVTVDFALDPGQSVRIHVQDSDGKPITGVDVHGLSSRDPVEKTEDAELTVTNLGPDEERAILFWHLEKRIGRVVRIGPAQLAAGEITVQLQPEGYVVGRLLDEDGEPFSGAAVEASGIPFAYATRLDTVGADAEGRFRAVLIPGCHYSLKGEPHRRGIFSFSIERDLVIEPGETKDLGTLQFDKKGKPIKRALTRSAIATDGS